MGRNRMMARGRASCLFASAQGPSGSVHAVAFAGAALPCGLRVGTPCGWMLLPPVGTKAGADSTL